MNERRYRKTRRAEQERETRQRIVEAAAALHGEAGPRDTTISAVAARAGVQRLTVYRHFPDTAALFRACTTHWLAANPPPGPADWQPVEDPAERTRTALVALYTYYRATEYMWHRACRDLDSVPALQAPMAEFERHLDGIRDDLVAAWTGGARNIHLATVLGHAVRFRSWQTLAAEGLPADTLADLVTRWVAALAASDGTRPGS